MQVSDQKSSCERFGGGRARFCLARKQLSISDISFLPATFFMQANVYNLSMTQSYWQSAHQNRIASLQNYWLSYYLLRRLTLYDYLRRQPICYVK